MIVADRDMVEQESGTYMAIHVHAQQFKKDYVCKISCSQVEYFFELAVSWLQRVLHSILLVSVCRVQRYA